MPTLKVWSDQRVLVTGASGFIGTHLCRCLARSGAEVYAMSRKPRADGENGCHWRQGDLRDIATAQWAFAAIKPETVIHLASHAWGDRSLELVMPTFHDNLLSTVNVLHAAAETGCRRFVLPGSLEEPEGAEPEAIPSSPYAAAKWAGTAYARMFHRLYQVPVVIPRIFMTYGPGQPARKLIPHVIVSLLRGESPKLSNGERRIDWIYIDDVVSGLLAAALAPKSAEGCTFDLGSGISLSIREIVDQIVTLMGSPAKPLFGALPDRPLEQERVADIYRSRAELSWAPSVSLEEGLKKTVEWHQRQLTTCRS